MWNKSLLSAVAFLVVSAGATAAPPVAHPLVGRWVHLTKVDGIRGGRMSNTWVQLNADGTYLYRWESSSSGPKGSAAGSGFDRGVWAATESSLTVVSRTGRRATFRLEKRNHPRNPRDPMIVLDGRAFVTATRRASW